MAIYHLSVKAVSRSAGRSSTAAAAYRAGCEITDRRTGEIHDYTRKGGVVSADIVLPDGAPMWANNRAELWNAAEAAERRKDACVAREFEVALPSELSPAERRRLAVDFAKEMANAEGCAVDVAIHVPGKEGDSRNHHAHILRTTRKVGPDGLTDKLDTEKAGRKRSADLDAVRTRWAELTNERLRENGIEARVDHRSLEAQGIDRTPTSHLGPAVSEMVRHGDSAVAQRIQLEVAAERDMLKTMRSLERQRQVYNQVVTNLVNDLSDAIDFVATTERQQHERITRDKSRHQPPSPGWDGLRSVWGSDNIHDQKLPESLLQPDAHAHARQPDARPGHPVMQQRDTAAAARVRPTPAVPAPARPLSYYHPESIAKREAEGKAAALAKIEAENEKEAMWAARRKRETERMNSRSTSAAKPPERPVEAFSVDGATELKAQAERPLLERIKASLAAFVEWVQVKSGVLRSVDVENGQYYGKVVQVDQFHVVSHEGRGAYAIHEASRLDKVPALDDLASIRYRGGSATVTVERKREQDQGRGR